MAVRLDVVVGAFASRSTYTLRQGHRSTLSLSCLTRLVEADVDVRLRDLPQIEVPAGLLMLQQIAAVAELEAGMISIRTRYAHTAV